jgi:hypothetical protein
MKDDSYIDPMKEDLTAIDWREIYFAQIDSLQKRIFKAENSLHHLEEFLQSNYPDIYVHYKMLEENSV